MRIAANTIVSLRYVMKNENDDVLEDTLNGSPVKYLHGSGQILPSLEACLEGLQKGQEKSLSISDETSGQLNEQFHFDLIIDDVRPATPEELRKRRVIDPTDQCGPGCRC